MVVYTAKSLLSKASAATGDIPKLLGILDQLHKFYFENPSSVLNPQPNPKPTAEWNKTRQITSYIPRILSTYAATSIHPPQVLAWFIGFARDVGVAPNPTYLSHTFKALLELSKPLAMAEIYSDDADITENPVLLSQALSAFNYLIFRAFKFIIPLWDEKDLVPKDISSSKDDINERQQLLTTISSLKELILSQCLSSKSPLVRDQAIIFARHLVCILSARFPKSNEPFSTNITMSAREKRIKSQQIGVSSLIFDITSDHLRPYADFILDMLMKIVKDHSSSLSPGSKSSLATLAPINLFTIIASFRVIALLRPKRYSHLLIPLLVALVSELPAAVNNIDNDPDPMWIVAKNSFHSVCEITFLHILSQPQVSNWRPVLVLTLLNQKPNGLGIRPRRLGTAGLDPETLQKLVKNVQTQLALQERENFVETQRKQKHAPNAILTDIVYALTLSEMRDLSFDAFSRLIETAQSLEHSEDQKLLSDILSRLSIGVFRSIEQESPPDTSQYIYALLEFFQQDPLGRVVYIIDFLQQLYLNIREDDEDQTGNQMDIQPDDTQEKELLSSQEISSEDDSSDLLFDEDEDIPNDIKDPESLVPNILPSLNQIRDNLNSYDWFFRKVLSMIRFAILKKFLVFKVDYENAKQNLKFLKRDHKVVDPFPLIKREMLLFFTNVIHIPSFTIRYWIHAICYFLPEIGVLGFEILTSIISKRHLDSQRILQLFLKAATHPNISKRTPVIAAIVSYLLPDFQLCGPINNFALEQIKQLTRPDFHLITTLESSDQDDDDEEKDQSNLDTINAQKLLNLQQEQVAPFLHLGFTLAKSQVELFYPILCLFSNCSSSIKPLFFSHCTDTLNAFNLEEFGDLYPLLLRAPLGSEPLVFHIISQIPSLFESTANEEEEEDDDDTSGDISQAKTSLQNFCINLFSLDSYLDPTSVGTARQPHLVRSPRFFHNIKCLLPILKSFSAKELVNFLGDSLFINHKLGSGSDLLAEGAKSFLKNVLVYTRPVQAVGFNFRHSASIAGSHYCHYLNIEKEESLIPASTLIHHLLSIHRNLSDFQKSLLSTQLKHRHPDVQVNDESITSFALEIVLQSIRYIFTFTQRVSTDFIIRGLLSSSICEIEPLVFSVVFLTILREKSWEISHLLLTGRFLNRMIMGQFYKSKQLWKGYLACLALSKSLSTDIESPDGDESEGPNFLIDYFQNLGLDLEPKQKENLENLKLFKYSVN